MLKEAFECRLCASDNIGDVIFHKVRGDITGKKKIVACGDCGHTQINSVWYDLEHYNNDQQVYSSIKECGTSFKKFIDNSWLEAQRRADRLQTGFDLNRDRGVLLDIGAGYGFFSHIINQSSCSLTAKALEPSRERISKGISLINEREGNCDPSQFEASQLDKEYVKANKESFDFVTMWHVLEHVPTPVDFLRLAYDLVKPGGSLSFEVPNAKDELLKLSPSFAKYSYMIEHISYFSPEIISLLIKKVVEHDDFVIQGYQRYGIFNYFNWIYRDAPLGESPDFIQGSDRWWLEKVWRESRENRLTTDALVANIRKPY